MACTLGHRRGLGRCAALRRCVRVRVAQPPTSFTTPSAATFYARNALVSGDHFTQNQAECLLQVFPTMKDVTNEDGVSRRCMRARVAQPPTSFTTPSAATFCARDALVSGDHFTQNQAERLLQVLPTMKDVANKVRGDHEDGVEVTVKDHISGVEVTVKDHISGVEVTMKDHISRFEETMKDHISRVEVTMKDHISRVEATMKTGFVEQQKFFVLLALAFPVLVAIFLALIFSALKQFPVDPSSVVGLLMSKSA